MKSMMILYEDYVRLMERGQITLPMPIRQRLSMFPKDTLRVRLFDDNSVVVSPVKPAKKSMAEFLKEFVKDKKVYWTKEDDETLKRARKKTKERFKRLGIW